MPSARPSLEQTSTAPSSSIVRSVSVFVDAVVPVVNKGVEVTVFGVVIKAVVVSIIDVLFVVVVTI